jgi:hypothetical protein
VSRHRILHLMSPSGERVYRMPRRRWWLSLLAPSLMTYVLVRISGPMVFGRDHRTFVLGITFLVLAVSCWLPVLLRPNRVVVSDIGIVEFRSVLRRRDFSVSDVAELRVSAQGQIAIRAGGRWHRVLMGDTSALVRDLCRLQPSLRVIEGTPAWPPPSSAGEEPRDLRSRWLTVAPGGALVAVSWTAGVLTSNGNGNSADVGPWGVLFLIGCVAVMVPTVLYALHDKGNRRE